MYNVEMPNVCLKTFTVKDMQTHCLFEFTRPQMPDSRIDHSSSAPASPWLSRRLIILSYFINVDDVGTVCYGHIESVT